MTYTLVRQRAVTRRLDLDSFARAAGLHPGFVGRLVTLGLLEASRDPTGGLWLSPGELAVAARIQRLRAGFCLNYAAVGLVMDLLDRIAELEESARRTGQARTRPTRG
ncbi:MAG TPA: chaperone modulator CbpM [Kineosporiaceae bacterium]